MFSIEEFKSQFQGGLRANRFEVEVAGLPNKSKFLMKSASIPGATLGEIPFKYQGVEVKFAADKTFEDWSVTMAIDEDFAGFNEIEAWHNLIRPDSDSRGANNHAQYKKEAVITMYSQSGTALAQWKIRGLWPKTIPSMDVSWDNDTQIMEVPITFSIDWRERVF